MGTLAGSTVMLLTLAWGISLFIGRCDIINGEAIDNTITRPITGTSHPHESHTIYSVDELIYLYHYHDI